MLEVAENIENGLIAWGELAEVTLNALSLICIVLGVIMSVINSTQERRRDPGFHPLHTYFRRSFGGWLIVALELQLGADIVGTIISPTREQLLELGVIALIRTFLNYFLGRELKEQTEILNERIKKAKETHA